MAPRRVGPFPVLTNFLSKTFNAIIKQDLLSLVPSTLRRRGLYHEVMAAAAAPNPQQRPFPFDFLAAKELAEERVLKKRRNIRILANRLGRVNVDHARRHLLINRAEREAGSRVARQRRIIQLQLRRRGGAHNRPCQYLRADQPEAKPPSVAVRPRK